MSLIFRHLCLIILGLLFSNLSVAQGHRTAADQTCEFKLTQARTFFEAGQLEKIPPLLSACVNSKDLSKSIRLSILKLLTESYLFMNNTEEAASTYAKILKIAPFYEIQHNVEHPEIVFLSRKFNTNPTFSFGVKAGANYTMVQSGDEFILEEAVSSVTESYEGALAYHMGVVTNYRIPNSKAELSLELLYANIDYDYNAFIVSQEENEDADLIFDEGFKTLSIPFSLKYNFRENSRGLRNLSYYTYVGASFNINLSARVEDISLVIRNNGTLGGPGGSSGINILDSNQATRIKNNFSLLGGVGLKYRIRRNHLFLDLRYRNTLKNIVKTENRFSNEELKKFWHIDNDLKWHTFYFSVGYCYSLYTVRRK